MADYKKLVKEEAKAFFKEHFSEFQQDPEEFGGQSDNPNFSKWLDRTEKLNKVAEKTVSGWSQKDFHWVQTNTRNPIPYGDARSNAYGSFYSDLLHELKRLKKQAGS